MLVFAFYTECFSATLLVLFSLQETVIDLCSLYNLVMRCISQEEQNPYFLIFPIIDDGENNSIAPEPFEYRGNRSNNSKILYHIENECHDKVHFPLGRIETHAAPQVNTERSVKMLT